MTGRPLHLLMSQKDSPWPVGRTLGRDPALACTPTLQALVNTPCFPSPCGWGKELCSKELRVGVGGQPSSDLSQTLATGPRPQGYPTAAGQWRPLRTHWDNAMGTRWTSLHTEARETESKWDVRVVMRNLHVNTEALALLRTLKTTGNGLCCHGKRKPPSVPRRTGCGQRGRRQRRGGRAVFTGCSEADTNSAE